MIVIGLLAAIVGPFLFGPPAFVFALLCFVLAAVDPLGRRLERRNRRRRDAASIRRLHNELEQAWLRMCAERNEQP